MHELTNQPVDFDRVDTLLLDMDGTLLDLNFDSYFWLQAVPNAYAESVGEPLSEVIGGLREVFEANRGTLNWYAIDFWANELKLDVMALQRTHSARIGYLAGAPAFLAAARSAGKRCMLVTNADRQTFGLKDECTGLSAHLDEVVSSHDFHLPKEHPDFWPSFFGKYRVDATRSAFFDDTQSVLDTAKAYGIGYVVGIARPDSQGVARELDGHLRVDGVRDLVRRRP
ncbi:MAG: HAD-IA family hydrolase [Gammaproteobacteria bacterium]